MWSFMVECLRPYLCEILMSPYGISHIKYLAKNIFVRFELQKNWCILFFSLPMKSFKLYDSQKTR